MSYKTRLITMAIKLTPDAMVVWVANKVLKGIAELSEFSFDIDTRKVFVKTTLYGETEAIEVSIDGFGIINDGKSYQFIIQHAVSNKPWLNNIMVHFVGKQWKIPVMPQFAVYFELIADVFKIELPTV